MGQNVVREYFDGPTSWVCPAGVTRVRVTAFETLSCIAPGGDHSWILATGGGYGFGFGTSGQLGSGGTVSSSSPVQMATGFSFSSGRPRLMVCGGTHGFLISDNFFANGSFTNGAGLNTNGQLGDNTVAQKSTPSPTPVTSTPWRIKTMATGTAHSVLIRENGDVMTMGANNNGQLGDNTITQKSTPTLVAGSLKFKKISCGANHTVGLATTGDVYAWGLGTSGQLGDNSIVSKSSPVLVSGGHKFVSIAGVNNASFGIKADGSAYSWGANSNGQLGLGDTAARSTPTLVTGGLSWRSISYGGMGDAVCGISKTGQGYSWGQNNFGQLGDSTTVPKSSPVLISGSLLWSDLRVGGLHMIGVDSKGFIYTWGYNGSGQLGDGTTVAKSSPILVNIFGVPAQTAHPTTRRVTGQTVIEVTPGTTYTIDTLGNFISFAGFNVGSGLAHDLTVELEYLT